MCQKVNDRQTHTHTSIHTHSRKHTPAAVLETNAAYKYFCLPSSRVSLSRRSAYASVCVCPDAPLSAALYLSTPAPSASLCLLCPCLSSLKWRRILCLLPAPDVAISSATMEACCTFTTRTEPPSLSLSLSLPAYISPSPSLSLCSSHLQPATDNVHVETDLARAGRNISTYVQRCKFFYMFPLILYMRMCVCMSVCVQECVCADTNVIDVAVRGNGSTAMTPRQTQPKSAARG